MGDMQESAPSKKIPEIPKKVDKNPARQGLAFLHFFHLSLIINHDIEYQARCMYLSQLENKISHLYLPEPAMYQLTLRIF
jgi:hypothetical protein